MKKILFIFGTRPETIKLTPVIHALKKAEKEFVVKVCVTAQHREMLDQMLKIFDITPDHDLNIMRDNQSLFDVTAEELKHLEKVFKKEKPDIVLVQGDTTTTFTASLAAYYSKTRVGHIEAGLRSGNKFSPFPEEINRGLTAQLADLHFAPTEKAKDNLINEHIDRDKVFITGNTVIDTLLMTVEKQKDRRSEKYFNRKFLENYGIRFNGQKVIPVTSHRRESFGENCESLCEGIRQVAEKNPDVLMIFPLHHNPNIKKTAKRILKRVKNIHLIEPLDYFSFIWVLNRAYLILTDSGGIQEEAPSLGKPVLVMRNVTERTEGIEAGTAKLIGTESEKIFSETMRLLHDKKAYQKMAKANNPYGDGKSSERIINILRRKLNENNWGNNKASNFNARHHI
jgi:UDP-N-acetylglucosamine 2-epimerase (non-hydrolysing)